MWKLQIFQNGRWKDYSEHKTGDAAKTAARRTARADTFCGTHITRYRIVDPSGNSWMAGTKKQCAGWFKIVWA